MSAGESATPWQDYRIIAEAAARLGGAVLRNWQDRFTVREKSRANLVTEADFASQQMIQEFLGRECPGHEFLGEEETVTSGSTSLFRWVVDPLDGTSNYVHGFPYYAVSIGLEHDGKLVAGAIYDPTRDEMFAASRGGGATLNGRALECSAVTTLSEAMCIASLPVATAANAVPVQRFLRAMSHVQTVQRTGSAALNLAYLAAGRIEGFWSSSLRPWDMAAGVLLVEEAGGIVTKISGETFDLYTPDLLGANQAPIHSGLRRILNAEADFTIKV